jgi:hypothetical protein
VAQALLVLGPIIEDRTAVEPDHVGELARVHHAATLGEADATEESQQIEGRLAAHLPHGLVIGEILDADHHALAEAAEFLRQTGIGVLCQGFEIVEGGSLKLG